MDAREREDSQRRPSIIKRPWEEEYEHPSQANIWNGSRLPSIDASSFRRPSLPSRVTETEDIWGIRSGSESRDGGAKRARCESYDYDSFPRHGLDLKSAVFRSTSEVDLHSHYTPSPSSPGSHLRQDPVRDFIKLGDAETVLPNKACHRCKRLIMQGVLSNENKDSTELLKSSAGLLNKTVLVLTRITPGTGGITRNGPNIGLSSINDCPPVEHGGLRHTLNWLLGRIQHVNDLAEMLMQHVPLGSSPDIDRDFTRHGSKIQDDLERIMKRRIDPGSGDTQRPSDVPEDTKTDAKLNTRRRSVATTLPGTEDFLSMRSSLEYHSHATLHSEPVHQVLMNPPPPPPAPNRQLPSPPGRSLPSPTSLNFSSPPSSSYGSSSQPPGHLPLSGFHQSSLGSYLPPIAPVHSPDPLQAHASALQHEVSVQKIDLSSLQDEHDNLLAAIKRSQMRAMALEKKQIVSDSEVVSLTEEKLRLQSQVVELERDVEELAHSRDEFRQAAVQEGAQYVEIVKGASRLEQVAGEERKEWNRLKLEMEENIEALGGASNLMEFHPSTFLRHSDTPISSTQAQSEMDIEPSSNPQLTTQPQPIQRDSNQELEQEIRRLRNRCVEVESALRAVQEESRSMEGIVEALGLAGKSILERADRALAGS